MKKTVLIYGRTRFIVFKNKFIAFDVIPRFVWAFN
jgi:hypothetical protein